jgi:hypothetical protein
MYIYSRKLMTVALDFNYSRDQIIRAYKLHYYTLAKKRDILIGILLLCLSISFLFLSDQKILWAIILAADVIVLSAPVILAQFVPAMMYDREPKYKNKYKLIFSDEGIVFQTNSIDSHLKWELYNYIIENKEFFLMYYGKGLFSIIPKGEFKHQMEMDQFRKYLAMHQLQIVARR